MIGGNPPEYQVLEEPEQDVSMNSWKRRAFRMARVRKIQTSTDWPMHDAFCLWFLDTLFGGHDGLTIGWLALHSTVLACHTHGFSSLLEQTGIIESQ
jgi:hypothetical protein